ncbi:ABC transporter permease [Thiospirochaeta perfilievii]|uniref:ABC transporter permease n=1 Tax=Thiospirochaeta perfilievii TaxID=252967 RepID=A0A5C1QC45_9SPIO|nr:FtsX-like permease family protein [Thiospirochaeta perfilievii]QEN03792.1 ABC transporter permease [Thiospirochaeta perfilievii]
MNNWIIFTSLRHLKTKRKEKGDTSTFLSVIGILSGVMTMITVIGVMNGFQGSNIDKRVEIGSGHVALEPISNNSSININLLTNLKNVKSFYKSSEFVTAASDGRDSEIIGLQVNSLPQNIYKIDESFKSWVKIHSGSFNINSDNSIIIGKSLAYSRHLSIGDKINLIAFGSKETKFSPKEIEYTISGIFRSGSIEYDERLVFISNESAERYFISENEFMYKFKIENRNRYQSLVNTLSGIPEVLDNYTIKSWKDYNTSYYNALKNEKDLMTILIGLIFLVVGINIYNSLRRSVYMRFEEISVLKTLGATSFDIRVIFILESFFIGFVGATLGVFLGLWIVNNINYIFEILENIVNFVFSFTNGGSISFYGPQFFYLNTVPVEVYLNESILVYLSAVGTSIIAAYAASKRISEIRPGEVIRNE